MTVRKSRRATALEAAANWRGFRWEGIDIGHRQGRFWGMPVTTFGRFRAKTIDWVANRRRFSAFKFSPEDIARYLIEISKFRPQYLYGYASMLRSLAAHVVQSGESFPADLRAVVSTSEPLTPPDSEDTRAVRARWMAYAAIGSSAWFVLTTFSKKWRAPAHTFVSFGFADGRYLAISVEARREAEEEYGILAGMFRRYELIYVLGDERDLIGRRVAVEGDATWLYPVRAPRERIRALLAGMATRAAELQRAPEFYHSFLNSCTSNLVAHVNAVAPGRIPAGWKVLVPGYTDDVALSLGLIDDSTSLETARQRYRIDRAVAARTIASDSFSAYIRRVSH